MKKNFIISILMISVITFLSGKMFLDKREVTLPIIDENEIKVTMLSEYSPSLKGSNGDTPIYHLKGKEKGGSVLVLGYNHPSEMSGNIATIAMIESLKVAKGDVYVIPYANRSAASHNQPGYGNKREYTIKTKSGEREFQQAHRRTNPIDQWPVKEFYVHHQSGKKLKGYEALNLNRNFPGKKDGSFTERVAYGITSFVIENDIDIVIDFHEASPESSITNTFIFHGKGTDIGSSAVFNMEMEGVSIRPELSTKANVGLTHWELGNNTSAYTFLFETINPAQGRLRGASTQEQLELGQDKSYVELAKMGRLRIPYPEEGYTLTERVARNLVGVNAVLSAVAEFEPSKEVYFENMPTYDEFMENGVGSYLK